MARPAPPTQTPYALGTAVADAFAYGVASGDMTVDSAVLWTRAPGGVDVVPELSETPGFERPTALPSLRATDASDFTIKARATGLEPDFPGLVAASVRAAGVPAGSIEPAAFASFNTFSYALLTLDPTTLTVQVKGFPSVNDPATLQKDDAVREYEGRQVREILSFQVEAK